MPLQLGGRATVDGARAEVGRLSNVRHPEAQISGLGSLGGQCDIYILHFIEGIGSARCYNPVFVCFVAQAYKPRQARPCPSSHNSWYVFHNNGSADNNFQTKLVALPKRGHWRFAHVICMLRQTCSGSAAGGPEGRGCPLGSGDVWGFGAPFHTIICQAVIPVIPVIPGVNIIFLVIPIVRQTYPLRRLGKLTHWLF